MTIRVGEHSKLSRIYGPAIATPALTALSSSPVNTNRGASGLRSQARQAHCLIASPAALTRRAFLYFVLIKPVSGDKSHGAQVEHVPDAGHVVHRCFAGREFQLGDELKVLKHGLQMLDVRELPAVEADGLRAVFLPRSFVVGHFVCFSSPVWDD